MLRMLDLFSGIGGFSLAADWTGCIETVAFCEIEPYCQKVLKKHWPDVPIFSDIKELNGVELVREHGAVDIVCGGFPCQPFSTMGYLRGTEDDRFLWPQMLRVIQETGPTWVIGENVANFVNVALAESIADLENSGFEVQSFIIPACAIGAPHRRDRVWIVANSGSRRWDGRDMCSDSQTQERGQTTSEWGTNREFTKIQRPSNRRIFSKRETWTIEPDVDRVVDGLSNGLDRIKAIGNSIVPQVAYQILQGIVDIERSLSDVD